MAANKGDQNVGVGVTRFELATTRPPDVYSNRAELHPEVTNVLHDQTSQKFYL